MEKTNMHKVDADSIFWFGIEWIQTYCDYIHKLEIYRRSLQWIYGDSDEIKEVRRNKDLAWAKLDAVCDVLHIRTDDVVRASRILLQWYMRTDYKKNPDFAQKLLETMCPVRKSYSF